MLDTGATPLVRPARPDDRDFILGLVGRFAEFAPPPWRAATEITDWVRSWLAAAFDAPPIGSAMFVAEEPEGPRLGFIYLMTHTDPFTGERHGHVSEIAVVRSRGGVGRVLMETAERWTRDAGMRLLTLNVFHQNEQARDFYYRIGFEPELVKFAKLL